MQNYRLTLAYDGTRYRGWQRLPPPAKTVQASVETALGEIFGQPLEISGSGRTDAGVHAACQVASFHAPKRPTDEVLAQLRRLLPEDIGALTLDYAPERFHARLSAVEKTYVYRLWNSDRPDVFARCYRAWEPRQLDSGAMRAGAAGLVGTHDFFTFCANRQMKKSTVRTLRRLDITQEDAELRFTLTADGFLYHMARILVGTQMANWTSLSVEPAVSCLEYFRGRRLIVINRNETPADARATLVLHEDVAKVFETL